MEHRIPPSRCTTHSQQWPTWFHHHSLIQVRVSKNMLRWRVKWYLLSYELSYIYNWYLTVKGRFKLTMFLTCFGWRYAVSKGEQSSSILYSLFLLIYSMRRITKNEIFSTMHCSDEIQTIDLIFNSKYFFLIRWMDGTMDRYQIPSCRKLPPHPKHVWLSCTCIER